MTKAMEVIRELDVVNTPTWRARGVSRTAAQLPDKHFACNGKPNVSLLAAVAVCDALADAGGRVVVVGVDGGDLKPLQMVAVEAWLQANGSFRTKPLWSRSLSGDELRGAAPRLMADRDTRAHAAAALRAQRSVIDRCVAGVRRLVPSDTPLFVAVDAFLLGGGGRRGKTGLRACPKAALLDALQRCCLCFVMDDFLTSQRSPCCHGALVAGPLRHAKCTRPLLCAECGHWWDRDEAAAANMAYLLVHLLAYGTRPAAFARRPAASVV